MHITVPSVEYEAMRRRTPAEASAEIKKRVDAARAIQQERFKNSSVACNAHMDTEELTKYCKTDRTGELLLEAAFRTMGLTARSYDRILRVARTIADLEGSPEIGADHLAEAIQYRNTDILKG